MGNTNTKSFSASGSGAESDCATGRLSKMKTKSAEHKGTNIDKNILYIVLCSVPLAIDCIFSLVNIFSNPNSEATISNPIKLREDAYIRKCKADIALKLRAIEDEDKLKTSPLHDPMHPDRPYGLPEEMEGFQGHIWDLIIVHVNDLDTIVNLREVCKLFRDLLERKYIAARLPEIIVLCLERKVIPWEEGGREELSNWAKTLSSLRILSKATKTSVDNVFDRGLLAKGDWFGVQFPHFQIERWEVPLLMLGALDVEQHRLDRALVEGSSVKALIFNECRRDGVPVNLQNLRFGFQRCVEKIGRNITSFRYRTIDNQVNVYLNLKKFVAQMPNLQELMVVSTGPRSTTFYKNVGAFPTCRNLRRYVQAPHGFGSPFINEIIKANPTIQELHLGNEPSSNLEMNNFKEVLDTLHLTAFHLTCTPTTTFLEHRFQWTLQLTILALWDTSQVFPATPEGIPSQTMFNFISSCKNLKKLYVMSSLIRDTGGYINLPVLEYIHWKIVPNFMSLEFLKPLASLNWLALDISIFPEEWKPTEKVMEFLGNWHIPSLFPGLKVIEAKTVGNGSYKKIWKSVL